MGRVLVVCGNLRILLLIILLGTLVIGCQQETAQPLDIPIESKTYNNTEYGFSLSYPRDWEIHEFDEKGIYTVSFEKEPRAVIQIWVFYASVYTLSVPTLDNFYKEAVSIWGDTFEEFRILEEHNITVDGLPARSITITFMFEGILWEQTVIIFLEKIPYSITYTPMGAYDNYFGHFNLIVDTFKFKP